MTSTRADVRKARAYPAVISAASPDPAVRAAATVESTARPSAPPIVREVLTSPETSPASPGAAPEVASVASGVEASPAPAIMRTPGRQTEVR